MHQGTIEERLVIIYRGDRAGRELCEILRLGTAPAAYVKNGGSGREGREEGECLPRGTRTTGALAGKVLENLVKKWR